MRICSYIVKVDNGFCPNPFWGYCTLSSCTPNHMGIKLEKGDWIVGFSTSVQGNKLVYAMEVVEVLSFDEYFTDRRFTKKKPDHKGSWKERCGDNIYFKDYRGRYKRIPSEYHCELEHQKKDLKHPYVYISKHFYYFGDRAIDIPDEFKTLVRKMRGCKCDHEDRVQEKFIKWLTKNHKTGVLGSPRDNKGGIWKC